MFKLLVQSGLFIFYVLTTFTIPTTALALDHPSSHIFLVHEAKHDTSLPLIKLRPVLTKKYRTKILPIHHLPHFGKALVPQKDVAMQLFEGTSLNIRPVLNFLGIGVGLGGFTPSVTPPDTTGAPGLTQYVQIVNDSFAIFNKANGNLEYGPVDTNTLWQGFGGYARPQIMVMQL